MWSGLTPANGAESDAARPAFAIHPLRLLDSELGDALHQLRKQTVEPVIGHPKHNRKFTRFHRRRRRAVRTEWPLQTMTHSLTKLHRYQIAALAA